MKLDYCAKKAQQPPNLHLASMPSFTIHPSSLSEASFHKPYILVLESVTRLFLEHVKVQRENLQIRNASHTTNHEILGQGALSLNPHPHPIDDLSIQNHHSSKLIEYLQKYLTKKSILFHISKFLLIVFHTTHKSSCIRDTTIKISIPKIKTRISITMNLVIFKFIGLIEPYPGVISTPSL